MPPLHASFLQLHRIALSHPLKICADTFDKNITDDTLEEEEEEEEE
jgi:hypothetical protein